MSVWLQFKNSTWLIPQWCHHTPSIKFLPWNSAFEVGCRYLSLSIHCLLRWTLSYKTYFSAPVIIFSRNRSFLCIERRLLLWICEIAYSSHKEYEDAEHLACSLFARCLKKLCFFKYQQMVDWDVWDFIEYFCVDCIQPVFLKHLDRGMIHFSMMYHQLWTWR